MDVALQRAMLLQMAELTYGSSQLSYLIENENQMATYFFSMLADVDRALQYQHAIESCIQDFAHAHPDVNPVHVLDIGVGTGLLTLFASQTKLPDNQRVKVLAVDTNKHVITYATKFLTLANKELMQNITLVQVEKEKPLAKLAKTKRGDSETDTYGPGSIDIVVSEILGTYVESEFMHSILKKYENMVKQRGNRFYMVPEMVTQSLVTKRLSHLPVGAAYMLNAFARRPSRNFQLTSSQHLSALLLTCGLHDIKTDLLVQIGEKAAEGEGEAKFFPRKRESWTREATSAQLHAMALKEDPRQGEFGLAPDESILAFVEWNALLWNPRHGPAIVLKNSLEGYKDAADPYTALARNEAWGVAVLGARGEIQLLGTLSESQTPNIGHYTLGHYNKPTKGKKGKDDLPIPDREFRMMLDYDFTERLVVVTNAKLKERGLKKVIVYEDCTGGMFPAKLAQEDVSVMCVFNGPETEFHATSAAMDEFNKGRSEKVHVYVRTRSNRAESIALDTLEDLDNTLCVIPKWILFDAKTAQIKKPHTDLETLPREPMKIVAAQAHPVTLLESARLHGLDKCGTAFILEKGFKKKSFLQDNAFLGVLKEASDCTHAFELLIDTPYVDDAVENKELPFCNVANLSRMTKELEAAWTTNKPRAMQLLSSIQARCTAHPGLMFSTKPRDRLPGNYALM